MRWLAKTSLRFRSLFHRRAADGELDSELRFHIERQVVSNIAAGMPPAEARRQALLEFGGVEELKEECRDMRKINWLQDFVQDVRFGLRMFRKSPGFTAVAVLTLALGIGANTAMFSALYGLVFRPLPYANSSRLVMLWDSNRATGQKHITVMEGSFPILRDHANSFNSMAAFAPANPRDEILSPKLWGTEEHLAIAAASPQLFTVLGVSPILGRTFTASEGVMTAKDEEWQFARVAILSYAYWRQHYGANPGLIGQTIDLNIFGEKRQYTIVGVMPQGFDFPYPLDQDKPDIWENLTFADQFSQGNDLEVVGSLKRGVSLQRAQAEIETIANQIRAQYPKYYKDEDVSVVPLSAELTHDVRTLLWVLLAAFTFILLIGCANVGNLLLVRAVSREKEMAIRTSLGAGRLDLVRQMLTEAMLLALVGGALGLLFAKASLRAFLSLLPQSIYIPRLNSVALDTRMLIFASLISVLAAGVFSVLPSLRLTRPNLNETLKSGRARKSSPVRPVLRRPGSALLVVEVSLALVLLVGALLMLRSMQRLLAVNSQFQPRHLLSMSFRMDNAYLTSLPNRDPVPIQFSQFQQRVEALPGVQAVALTDHFPPYSLGQNPNQFKAEGGGGLIAESFQPAELHIVTPNYFDMMGMSLVRGRWLEESDRNDSLPVAVINEAMAQRYWRDRDPLGVGIRPQLRYSPKKVPYTIVGVIREPNRFASGETPQPAVYFAYLQMPIPFSSVVIRTATDPTGLAAAVHNAALDMVPGHMFAEQARTGEDLILQSSAEPRFAAQLLTAFSSLALLLAMVGTYGLVSYYTSQRTHEIGIRMALGAQRGDVMRLVLKESMLIVALGVVIGVVAASAFTRTLSSFLYGVTATDVRTFAASAAVLVIVALAACYIPARRAMRVDPMVALRYE